MNGKDCDNVFFIIKTVEPCEGFFSARKQKREISEKPPTAYRTEHGLPFMSAEVLCGEKGLDWDEIRAKCGRYSSRLILPKSIDIPDDAGVSRFIPSAMKAILNFNTAVEIFNIASLPASSFSLSVIDLNARFAGKLCKLLPLCSSIKIITDRPEIYAPYCAEAYEKCGASVMLREKFEKGSLRDAVICCENDYEFTDIPEIVFSYSGGDCGNTTVHGSGIRLTDEHRRIIGESIDPVDFAGALTELCSCREYCNSVYENINIRRINGSSAFNDLIEAINT